MHIPHGECYSGQSVGVPYSYFGLRKLSSVVTRSTLELFTTRWKLWAVEVPLVAKVDWSLTRKRILCVEGNDDILQKVEPTVLLVSVSFNCAEDNKVIWELFSGKRCGAFLFLPFLRRMKGMFKRPWDWSDQNCQTRLQCCAVTSVVGASTHMWDGCSNIGRKIDNRSSVFNSVLPLTLGISSGGIHMQRSGLLVDNFCFDP